MAERPVVIFGAGELAELACFYFEHDVGRKVAGFTVDGAFIKADSLLGRPVVPFETVQDRFTPESCDLFVAIGYSDLNRARANKCAEALARGYQLASCISRRALVWPDLQIGRNAFVMEGTTIQPFVRIGNHVIVWANTLISHHVVIADDCFVAAEVVVSGAVTIGARSFLGVNATIRDHVTIGEDCIIGARTLINRDTPAGSTYVSEESERSTIPSRRFKSLL